MIRNRTDHERTDDNVHEDGKHDLPEPSVRPSVPEA